MMLVNRYLFRCDSIRSYLFLPQRFVDSKSKGNVPWHNFVRVFVNDVHLRLNCRSLPGTERTIRSML